MHQPDRAEEADGPHSAFLRIYEIARQIPHGRVATYGQIAQVMGPPVTARDVGDAMAALRDGQPDPPVPWQRVINAQGRVSTGQRQQTLLEQEGVTFTVKGVTDLGRFGWQGPDPEWAVRQGLRPLKNESEKQQLDLF